MNKLVIGVRAGGSSVCVCVGGGGAAAPLVLKLFGQNAYDADEITWDKLFIESSFYNTTKRPILKRFNGSAADLPIASICCSSCQTSFPPIHRRRENAYAVHMK